MHILSPEQLGATLAWPEWSKTLSMKIGKGKSLNEIEPVHFQEMAAENDLGWPMIRERMTKLCQKVLEVLSERNLQSETTNAAMAGNVARITNERTSYMVRKLRNATWRQ